MDVGYEGSEGMEVGVGVWVGGVGRMSWFGEVGSLRGYVLGEDRSWVLEMGS